MLARAAPVPRLTAELSSFTAQVSPFETSKPASAIRLRAATPASNHVEPFPATHFVQAPKWISASAWKFGPSARISCACPERISVLSELSGGTEMKYWAHG